MRGEILRLYKSVHTWTGIVAGMLLFVCFYAGALTIFAEPLARWASPPTRRLHFDRGRRSRSSRRHWPRGPRRPRISRFISRRRDQPATFDLAQEPQRRCRLVRDARRRRRIARRALERFWRRRLCGHDPSHRRPSSSIGRSGTTVMGVVSAVYAVALVSGLIAGSALARQGFSGAATHRESEAHVARRA